MFCGEEQKTMTSTHSLTHTPTQSGHFARTLLAAWDNGDLPGLRDELSQIAVADRSHLSAFEEERIEIVQGVAQTIRVWLNGARKRHADLNIALSLLRHLATVDEASLEDGSSRRSFCAAK